MASTLHTDLTTWRGTNQNNGGLAKQLNINGTLYDIQDPAVDQLATLLDTVIDNLETSINEGVIGESTDTIQQKVDLQKDALTIKLIREL